MRDRKSDSHRKAAEAKLGRKVKPGHDIDHLDENKDNNSPSNLAEKPHGAHSSATNSKSRKSLRALQSALQMTRKGIKSY
jgi:hypothetical protein